MNTPSLLIGSTLILWGVQSGMLWVAVAAALFLEGSRFVDRRRIFTPAEFRRIVFICDFLLLGIFIYSISIAITTTGDYVRAGFNLIHLLPLAILPLMVVQSYGTDEKIDIRKLSLYVSKKINTTVSSPPINLDISYIFWGISLLAASMAESKVPWFYGWLCLFVAWGLWGICPKYVSAIIWIILLICVSGVGLLGHVQLHLLQGKVEDSFVRLLSGTGDNKNADPSRSVTAIGRIGKLKLSGRILLRVKPERGISLPFLLREASYSIYRDETWLAGKSMFQTIQPESGGSSWQIAPASAENRSLRISALLEEGKGLLPLPIGTTRITGLPVGEMKLSRLGTIMVKDGPGRLNYDVSYDPVISQTGPPTELDLQVPGSAAPVLSSIAADLGLARQSPDEIVKSVVEFFRNNFRYATVQKELKPDATAIEDFLLRSHTGHCEFFATASVLLLRSGGIPARYVTGYSVQEFSQLEKVYLVRSRHAHAWSEAYVNGAWRTLDTTPQSWIMEDSKGVRLQFVADLGSWLAYRFSTMQLMEFRGKLGYYFPWLFMPVIIFLAFRLLRSQWQSKQGTDEQKLQATPPPGADSEWYLLERQLAQAGLAPHSLEKSSDWLERLALEPIVSEHIAALERIVSLHRRYRFDPDGITPLERIELKNTIENFDIIQRYVGVTVEPGRLSTDKIAKSQDKTLTTT